VTGRTWHGEPVPDEDLRAHARRILPHSSDIYIWPSPTAAPSDPGELTVTWLAARSPNSHQPCLRVLASWLAYCSIPLIAGPEMVEAWLDGLSESRDRDNDVPPPTTVRHHLAVITSWYRHLHEHGACRSNPAARVKAPPPGKSGRTRRALSPAAAAVLVELSHEHTRTHPSEQTWRDHCILTCLFHYGLLARTLAALEITDVIGIQDARTVSIWIGRHHPRHPLLDLPDTAAEALRTYLALRADRLQRPLRAGTLFAAAPTGSTTDDRPLSDQQIRKIIGELCGAAGLPARWLFTPCPPPADQPLPHLAWASPPPPPDDPSGSGALSAREA
jgi:site-specific recombinase XerD